MAEDLDILDSMKMEIDEDEEDVLLYEELEDTKEFDVLDDPLLMLTPIVHTTKLDDMKILNIDLSKSTPKEILNLVQLESKPKTLRLTNKRELLSTDNSRSFIRLRRVLNDLYNSYESKNEHYNIYNDHNMLHKPQNVFLSEPKALHNQHNLTDNQQNNMQESHSANVNTKQDNQCKPCVVVLKDIKCLLKTNQTVKVSMNDSILFGISGVTDDDLVKQELLQEAEEIDSVEKQIHGSIISDNEIVPQKIKEVEQDVLTTHKSVKGQSSKSPHSIELSKKLGTKDESLKNISSAANRKRSRSSYVHQVDNDNEEDNVPLQTIKKKRVVNTTNKENASTSAPLQAIDVVQVSSIERYALVVLIQEKKKMAYVYRVNPIKLVTDYFITKQFDEYELASMYPKEEKFIETFCCWYKREEIITKICSRKNYPYSIQKFMKQPHDCDSDDCDCCCRKSDNINIQTKHSARRAAINKSVAIADNWIQNLLIKYSDSNVGLVNKAINYIQKVENTMTRREERQTEPYLENTLLCLKNSSANTGDKTHFELYDIGKNGDVVKSFETDDEDVVYNFRKTYQFMSSSMREIRDTECCCWFKREKIMLHLKTINASPTALKFIQKAHMCANNKCFCCCKPKSVTLRNVEILPASLNHTTTYDKNERLLSIKLNDKSKNKPINKSLTKNVYASKKTTAAIASSNCISKTDNPDLKNDNDKKNVLKNVKLGVNSDGKIEAILDLPAKNLSVTGLKELSDIIDFSTKQIAELGVTAEEFCDKVGSKSIEISRLLGPTGATLIATLLSNNQGNKRSTRNNDDFIDIGTDSRAINETNRQTSNKDTIQKGNSRILNPSNSIEALKTTASLETQSCNDKSKTNMFSSLSSLMENKNKNYINSFKSYFSQSEPLKIVIPELHIFSPTPICITAKRDTNIETDLSKKSSPMPIIRETFTLAKSSIASTYVKPEPSRSSPRPKEMTSNVEISITNIAESEIKQERNTTITKAVPMLRVKPVSELIDPNFTLSPLVANNLLTIPNTTPPIVLNGTLEGNTILRPIAPKILIQRPDTQTQTLFIADNKSLQVQLGQTNNPNNQYQGGHLSVSRSLMTNTDVNGMEYITLRPINSQKVTDTVNNGIVAQALTPQVVSNATLTVGGGFPQLVPIRSTPPKQYIVTKQNHKTNTKILKQNVIKKT